MVAATYQAMKTKYLEGQGRTDQFQEFSNDWYRPYKYITKFNSRNVKHVPLLAVFQEKRPFSLTHIGDKRAAYKRSHGYLADIFLQWWLRHLN